MSRVDQRRDKPTTYLGASYYVPSCTGGTRASTLPMSNDEKEEARKREATKKPFGFAAW